MHLGEQSAPPRPKAGRLDLRRSNAGLCVGTVLFILLSLCLEYTGLLSLSRTQKDREIKWCRVSPRGLNVSARARASDFFVVVLNNVGQTHASSRTNDSHTHTPEKKREKKERSLSRDHRVNLTRLHASLTIAVLEWVSEIPSVLHGTH